MQISFYGAANEVTGSCHLVETDRARVIVDCGMFQGPRSMERRNRIPKALKANELDAVVLTHGHLDHCGRLPLLVNAGYKGPIYATPGTIDIARLILTDAAKIQQDDNKRENRHRRRRALPPVAPLFTYKDVARVCQQFVPIEYDRWHMLGPGITVRPVEAGHILGSACLEMSVQEQDDCKRVVFSGDLGQWNVPIMRDPARIESADVVVMESTYGNRNHRSLPETIVEFKELIKTAVQQNGKILIPTFAVGRTQQLLYHLAEMFHTGEIPRIPVYLDSPMAIAATEIYNRHWELMDAEARARQLSGQLSRDLVSLVPCQTVEESKALNQVSGPCIIMAGAGMCNAGRILHHMYQNLNQPQTIVIIVGYQAKGSLGRELLEGASSVKIFGETIHVEATVKGLGGFSAHADQSELLSWLDSMAASNPAVILTHGENSSTHALAAEIQVRFGLPVEIPKLYETISISGQSKNNSRTTINPKDERLGLVAQPTA